MQPSSFGCPFSFGVEENTGLDLPEISQSSSTLPQLEKSSVLVLENVLENVLEPLRTLQLVPADVHEEMVDDVGSEH